MAKYLPSHEVARLIFLKPLFTEIEKNNCFNIYTRSDLNKIREETIQKYDLIDRSGQLDTRQFKICEGEPLQEQGHHLLLIIYFKLF